MNQLLGFGIAGYRSFGPDLQLIGPLGKLNLIAGPNNAGKSNVLTFVRDHLKQLIDKTGSAQPHTLAGLDLPNGVSQVEFKVAIPIANSEKAISDLSNTLAKGRHEQEIQTLNSCLTQLLNSGPLLAGSGVAWITISPTRSANGRNALAPELMDVLTTVTDGVGNTSYGVSSPSWQWMWKFMAGGSSGGSLKDHWVPECTSRLVQRNLPALSVIFVPAYRQMTSDDLTAPEPSGKGLIHALAKLERPTIDRMPDQLKFARIIQFFRDVTQVPDALLEIPNDRKTIHVRINGRTLPLQNLGTGIHQVVMLAAIATLYDDQLICLEEPEMNLHPGLQKHLVRYLQQSTSNQYLISTHSAHILDTEGAAVFMVESNDGWTNVRVAKTPAERFAVCTTLGYRASDLLQANAVVWVEGPSDRLYLLWWLRHKAADLIEGIHFSIMFYGGRLLSHLTTEDDASQEFIELKRLNRNLAVLMDSDKGKASASIGATKLRIAKELDPQKGGVAWITSCRMIENYVPVSLMNEALAKFHPKVAKSYTGAQFDSPFADIENPRKIEIAEYVVSKPLKDFDRFGLEQDLDRLVLFVRGANPPTTVSETKPRS